MEKETLGRGSLVRLVAAKTELNMKVKRVKRNAVYPNYCTDHLLIPIVGDKFCRERCPFYRGSFKIFGYEFIKCKIRHDD